MSMNLRYVHQELPRLALRIVSIIRLAKFLDVLVRNEWVNLDNVNELKSTREPVFR